ncbi:MAG: alpha/beta fold hydrolase [Acidimicrobiales bacterium]
MSAPWTAERHLVRGAGGDVEVVVAGPREGLALVFHYGTPGGAEPWPEGFEAAGALGLRSVFVGSPGYGASTPCPGRRVADVAGDVESVLDAIGAERFVTAGWSGGGPHALACAALLGERCLGVATIAGVAPFDAEGLDWLEGMGPENREEFALALAGDAAALRRSLGDAAQALREIGPDQLVDAFGGLLSEPDRACLHGPFAAYVAATMRRAVVEGVEGWYDDDKAFMKPWGFDLEAVAVPVIIWRADLDLMVPPAHGAWLAAHVPGAKDRLVAGQGHLSLLEGHYRAVVSELRLLAVTG